MISSQFIGGILLLIWEDLHGCRIRIEAPSTRIRIFRNRILINICVHTNSVWLFPVWIQPSTRIRDCDLHIANYQQMSMRKSSPRSDIAPSKMADCCSQNSTLQAFSSPEPRSFWPALAKRNAALGTRMHVTRASQTGLRCV